MVKKINKDLIYITIICILTITTLILSDRLLFSITNSKASVIIDYSYGNIVDNVAE